MTGTGIIRGRVIDENGSGIAGARVKASFGRQGEGQPEVLTDAGGRFELKDLPPRVIPLEVSRDGFTTRGTMATARRQVLARNDEVRDLTVTLVRPGVIIGRVLGADGEPAVDASVQPMAVRTSRGARQLMPGRSGVTDDQGRFRLHSLAPGEYYLMATARNRHPPVGPTSDGSPGHATTYYPGTTDPGEARTVVVSPGAEASADLTLQQSPMCRISAVVLDADGRRVTNASIRMASQRRLEGFSPFVGPGTSYYRGLDGRFTLTGIPLGRYTITARLDTFTPAFAGTAPERTPPPQADLDLDVTGDIEDLVLRLNNGAAVRGRVVFAGQAPADVTEVRLAPEPLEGRGTIGGAPVSLTAEGAFEMAGVRGRLAFRVTGGWLPGEPVPPRIPSAGPVSPPPGGATPAPAAPPPQTTAPPPGATATIQMQPVQGAATAPSGTVRPGTVMGRPWRVRAVRVNGRDVTEEGLNVKGTDPVEGIEIEVARDFATVTGVVRDRAGTPVVGATVLPLPVTPPKTPAAGSYWPLRGMSLGRSPGEYFVSNLEPGAYDIVAIGDTEDVEQDDPRAVERLRARATRITVGEAQRVTLDLVVGR
jgi:hypothetical protein